MIEYLLDLTTLITLISDIFDTPTTKVVGI